jgi:hypothetical protein
MNPGRKIMRALRWTFAVLAALVVVLAAVAVFVDEPLRKRIERDMNAQLEGYEVRIGALDFHPLGFSIDLEDAVVIQEKNPDPPVMSVPRLTASVHWRELLHAALVADLRMERPKLHINRKQTDDELEDPVPIEERGWQDAVQEIYPLKINEFRISDGEVTYVDQGPLKPMELHAVNFRASNIRNVRSRDRTYPSELHLDATLFEDSRLVVDGHADFLAEPHAGVNTTFELKNLELAYVEPILTRYSLSARRGRLTTSGRVEDAPAAKVVDVSELLVTRAELEYVNKPAAQKAEKRFENAVEEAGKQVSDEATIAIRAEKVRVTDSTFGYTDRTTTPPYRLFVNDADLTLTNFSNQGTKPSQAVLRGRFMDSGTAAMEATFQPASATADLGVDMRIENAELRTMNDLWRAYGNFDVAAGRFSLYSEVSVKDGTIDVYVKPLFQDMDIYEERQDADKGVARKLYENVLGGVASVLQNQPRDQVATKTSLSGPLENPRTSTLEAVFGIIRNAFFKAILPGLDQRRARE